MGGAWRRFLQHAEIRGAAQAAAEHLHWSFWESYSTWLTGFALFTVSYLWNASTYLIDRSKMDWQPGTAVAVALAFFVVFWLVYDGICRLFGRGRHGDVVVGALVAVFIAAASWLACHWFAGRAAFLLVGAMMATTMSANVFFWIIPGQRKNVAAMKAGLPVDPCTASAASSAACTTPISRCRWCSP